MPVSFDFHTMSLTIDMTLDEYAAAAGIDQESGQLGILGLALLDVTDGDRSQFLRFRHEHAHFTSFVATGLADLYGVVSDYLLVALHSVVRRQVESGSGEVVVPLLDESTPDRPELEVVRPLWNSVNQLRAFLFGFGTRAGLDRICDVGVHDEFWGEYFEEAYRPIVERYYTLLDRVRGGPADAAPAATPALPRVPVDGRQKVLTARSVMEAYAVAIELVAAYFVSVTTELTTYYEPPGRDPGQLYTVALDYCLGRLMPHTSTSDYFAGTADRSAYYLVMSTTYAAMQVPVIQSNDGNVFLGAGPDALCVARRFQRIVDGVAEGRIPWPPEDPKNVEDRDARVLDWLRGCHAALGSEEALDIDKHVLESTAADPEFAGRTSREQSLIDLSWAARANLMREPVQYVYDAGLFAETYDCQPRYVRTGDNRIVVNAELGHAQATYAAEHAVPVLEAAVFAEQWDVAWAKLPELPAAERTDFLQSVYGYAGWALGWIGDDRPAPVIPTFRRG